MTKEERAALAEKMSPDAKKLIFAIARNGGAFSVTGMSAELGWQLERVISALVELEDLGLAAPAGKFGEN